MTKLVVWLRANIHPQILVHLGLQPSIAAGCVVRTANKQFDFSLSEAFEKQRELLIASLKETSPLEKQSSTVPTQTPAVAIAEPDVSSVEVKVKGVQP